MTIFLKKDLDSSQQIAIARLSDSVTELNCTQISQAVFMSTGSINLQRFGTDDKFRKFFLSHSEMETLVTAWQEYQHDLAKHTVQKVENKAALVAAACKLARSIRFDYEFLNVKITTIVEDLFRLEVPVIGYERRVNVYNLLDATQDALGCIHNTVRQGEENHWSHNEWDQIIASYRRKFPVDPQKIIDQTRDLLKQSAYLTGWTFEHIYPGTIIDCWSFDNGLGGTQHFALLNKTATDILVGVNKYLIANDIPRSAAEQAEMDA